MKLLFNRSLSVITFSFAFLFANPIFSAPPNLTLIKNELKNYHDSGLYQKELAQIITKAQKYIDQQAELNKKEKTHKKLAVVLDIDETSLSNYKYMIARDFGGNHKQFHKDIMAADAPPIKPMLNLYRDARQHGVKVFFVTGRNESERKATEKNLHQAGYSGWSGLYLRPINYSSKSIIPFKSNTRKAITEKGYTIVASIGDQYSDLKGGYAQKVFKLPNPFYYLP
ncbi:HAD family acid phosphatase [Fluoribacter dumoffii]|uniref:HAD family acid phosphatase n=1 Tax=Fluoribacter dumoffii TaxID=463 RepID=UPI002242E2F1|nr:HAD family acid phosphatase [Fluoribacter dumoffii]MCW8419634.1 HAD family acid phosphatase [Fluoribacter dumoffii]MCW8455663.1 HAD family acid phosphatase [Fluoribacter dumoffii]MCW8460258.1 HAD family acid phosphatase [Fluoribacter dumoffii]MCW8483737.1 HAD family acid phosphatase [Fluoribacter dumoffii]